MYVDSSILETNQQYLWSSEGPRLERGVPQRRLASRRQIVLIDDDAAFCKIVAAFAESRGLRLDWFRSLQEMGSVGRLSDYATAIVDFDLGQMNGVEIAEYLPAFFGKMPMVLISGKERKRDEDRKWPSSIRKFVHKDAGPDAILDEAVNLLDEVVPRRGAVARVRAGMPREIIGN